MHTNIRRSVIAFALLLLSLAAVRPIARAADEPARGDYVGQLQGLERGAIAISTDGRSVLAYVCDGTAEHVTVAQWFKGTPSANTLSLGAGRATLDARLDTDRASGTVTLADGRTFAFRAVAVADPAASAGLFRSELDSGGHHYIAGWIEEPARTELQPAQVTFADGWIDWSNAGALGGIIDELRFPRVAPTIGPATTRIASPIGELDVRRVRQGRTE